jgi:hypothetical protein
MRLLITSYQKSGTHQIMPMFEPIADVVDRCGVMSIAVAKLLGEEDKDYNPKGLAETAEKLRTFEGRRFGHIYYRPEYAQALQSNPTKVLFNVRDPRDIVVAEYENMKREYLRHGRENHRALWDFYDTRAEMTLYQKPDTISDLIRFASYRWPHWLGWLDYDWVLPVKYEELRLHTVETCQKIHDWLGGGLSPISAGEMAVKAKPRHGNPTFRRGIPGEWVTAFSDEHKKLSEELLGEFIEKLGYEI